MCWHLEREVFSIEGNGILHGARLGTFCVARERERERGFRCIAIVRV